MQRMKVGEGAPPQRPGGNCLGEIVGVGVRYYGYGNSGYVDRHHRRYRGLHPEGRMNLAGERTPPPPELNAFTLPRSDTRRLDRPLPSAQHPGADLAPAGSAPQSRLLGHTGGFFVLLARNLIGAGRVVSNVSQTAPLPLLCAHVFDIRRAFTKPCAPGQATSRPRRPVTDKHAFNLEDRQICRSGGVNAAVRDLASDARSTASCQDHDRVGSVLI